MTLVLCTQLRIPSVRALPESPPKDLCTALLLSPDTTTPSGPCLSSVMCLVPSIVGEQRRPMLVVNVPLSWHVTGGARRDKSMGAWHHISGVEVLVLPYISCESLGELLTLSVSQFSHL